MQAHRQWRRSHAGAPQDGMTPLPDGGRIAVIGAAGRVPGADDLQQYWDLLLAGRVVAAEPDSSRAELWRAMGDPDLASRITTLKGGYLKDIAAFDADYFSISPREAVKLDPQQRLLLECVHDALEDAAVTRADLQSLNVGVFVGAGSTDYSTIDSGDKRQIDGYHGIGNSHSLLANRLSYYYNLKGPSLTIDTACSSSLVALHFAIQSLRYGGLDMAIVGGVSLVISPDLTLAFSQAKMLSPSGRCNTFSAEADGYGRAEGVGAVVLTRLADAEDNHHAVRCVVRASALNQDGRSNGITAPNGPSQVQVIQSAMAAAGVSPADMAYMETHGTGTPLGDAIEFNSLKTVFAKHPEARCLVGSAKANIGHTEAAAGISGLLKAMLMLEHKVIPPHPVKGPYSDIIARSGETLQICQTAQPIDPARPCIGVSSFGFGGANAHVIVEGHAAPADPAPEAAGPFLVPLSSHNPEALAADAEALAGFLATAPVTLTDLAHTLAEGRDHLKYRKAFAVRDRADLLHRLTQPFEVARPLVKDGGEKPKVAFVFTGQGAQYVNMGRGLYEHVAPFRAAFDQCDALVQARSGIAVAALLYGAQSGDDAALLENTHLGQLSLFCFEYALASYWMSLGIQPSHVIGHSLGELVAQTISGALGLSDAVALVNERARLMQAESHAGAMIALFVEAASVTALIDRLALPLHIAAVNGRKSTVVSGDRDAVARLEQHLVGENIPHRRLKTHHAFHTPLFDKAAAALQHFAGNLPVNAGTIPVVSNLDGAILPERTPDPDYWGRHIVNPVLFAEGIDTLVALGVTVFLEIGPDRVLAQQIARDHGGDAVRAVSSIQRDKDSEVSLLQAVAAFYQMGFDVPFDQLAGAGVGRKVQLPARRLCRRSYWTTAPEASAGTSAKTPIRPSVSAPGHDLPCADEAWDDGDDTSPLSVKNLIDRQITVMRSQLALLNDH